MSTVNEKAVKAEAELEELEKQVLEGSQPQGDEPEGSEDTDQKPEGEQTPSSEPAPDKPNSTATEKPENKGTEKPEGEGSEDDVDMSQLSEKAQKRFRDLAEKKKELEDKLLEERKLRLLSQAGVGAKPTTAEPGKDNKPTPLPWDDANREITMEEYERDVEEKAQKIVQGELKKEKMVSAIREDITGIERDYPEFKPGSPNYSEAMVVKVSEWFKILHRQNPQLRLRSFVDELMELKSKGADEAKTQITAKVVKQAATQALTPSGVKPVAQGDINDKIKGAKTLKELDALEAEIGIAQK